MNENQEPPATSRRFRRFGNFLHGLPAWFIGLVIVVPIPLSHVFDFLENTPFFQFGVRQDLTTSSLTVLAISVPASLKRWRGKHILFMIGAGIVGKGTSLLLPFLPVGEPWVMQTLQQAVPFFFVALGEAILLKKARWKSVACIVAASFAAAAVVELAFWILWFEDWTIILKESAHYTKFISVGGLAQSTVPVIIFWTITPIAVAVSDAQSRFRKVSFGVAMAIAISLFPLFILVFSFPLAERSLIHGGPFGKTPSANWLATRGTGVQRELLWHLIAERDWKRSHGRLTEDQWNPYDWRETAIFIFHQQNPDGTAAKLSGIFIRHPNVFIAEDSADIFAQHKRYETVPLLLRFALVDDSWECADAVEKLGVPQAALALMLHEMKWKRNLYGTPPKEFEKDTCVRLAQLIGEDAGPKVKAWSDLYDRVIAKAPTPLPAELRAEADQIVAEVMEYFRLAGIWKEFVRDHVRNAASTTKWPTSQEYQGYLETLESERKAEQEFSAILKPPDWNVPTTADLEREIEQYRARLLAILKSQNGSSIPSTKPCSATGSDK